MHTWVKEKDLASRFGVSTKTIRRWSMRGMPHVRLGHVVLFSLEDCDQWLQSRAADRTACPPSTPPTGKAGRPRRIVPL